LEIKIKANVKIIETPLYTVGDVAHHLRLPRSSVLCWSLGQEGSEPVIEVADKSRRLMSFRNLVEVFSLSSLLRGHEVHLSKIRKAISYVKKNWGSDAPLFDRKFLTDGKEIFVRDQRKLICVSEAGQMAMRPVMVQYLSRLKFGDSIPFQMYPVTTPRMEFSKHVVLIDPNVRFGQPCIKGSRIPTATIAERYTAGDSIKSLVKDYGRKATEIEEAIRYELGGRAA